MSHSLAAWLLALGMLAYIAVFTAAAWYKYDTHMMGFDLGVHEQVLWNTAHGRIAASSVFDATSSYFGIDIIPTELLLTPIYALLPSARTMLALQVIAVALGAMPVYLIVRDRFAGGDQETRRPGDQEIEGTSKSSKSSSSGLPISSSRFSTSEVAGLIFAVAFLLYLPVEYTTLYEFQIRAFATTFLLWAWWALERRRFWLFLGMVVLALGCRSEAGLVVAGMGLYSIFDFQSNQSKTQNRKAKVLFGLLPIVLGLAWFVVCLQVLIPYFRGGVPSVYLSVVYGHLGNTPDTPRWLGDTPGEIFRTLLTQPGFVLREVFTGADGAKRWSYLLQMFLPFGFLMLLQPRLMLITLPIFALNLLSNTPGIHASVQKHYQALSVPFLVIGAAYGLHWLLTRREATRRGGGSLAALGVVLLLSLGCNLYFRNPFFSLLDPKRTDDSARIAAVERAIAQVPPDAALTTTSTVGPHAARRIGLYYVPGNVIYPANKVGLGEYLLLDPQDVHDLSGDQQAQVQALTASNGYQQLLNDHGVTLWKKR